VASNTRGRISEARPLSFRRQPTLETEQGEEECEEKEVEGSGTLWGRILRAFCFGRLPRAFISRPRNKDHLPVKLLNRSGEVVSSISHL